VDWESNLSASARSPSDSVEGHEHENKTYRDAGTSRYHSALDVGLLSMSILWAFYILIHLPRRCNVGETWTVTFEVIYSITTVNRLRAAQRTAKAENCSVPISVPLKKSTRKNLRWSSENRSLGAKKYTPFENKRTYMHISTTVSPSHSIRRRRVNDLPQLSLHLCYWIDNARSSVGTSGLPRRLRFALQARPRNSNIRPRNVAP